MPTPEEGLAMEDYLHQCLALVVWLDGLLPSRALTEAQHLIDREEPSPVALLVPRRSS